MQNFSVLLLVFASLVSVSIEASSPIHACRVDNTTRKDHADLVNNAGCVVSRGSGAAIEFLLVYVEKSAEDRGWGFPGGKPATMGMTLRIRK